MSEFNNLRITYKNGAGDDWLRLEQPDWPEEPEGGFLAWLVASGRGLNLATVNEYFDQYKSHCMEDGSCEVELQVHCSRADLPYVLSTSFGELSGPFAHTADKNESVTISGVAELQLDYRLAGELSAGWEGPVYDVAGRRLDPPPEIMVAGTKLSFGQSVAGVLRFSYTAEYDAYLLTIEPRVAGNYEADRIETAYQATAMAVWSGGVVAHEVELPSMSGYCRGGGGSSTTTDPDDPAADDPDQCFDLYITKHKCTGEIINERKVPVPCPEEDDA